MPTLRIFNPENDIALAYGLAHFTAPKNAAAFAADCSFLPVWLSDDADFVAYSTPKDEDWESAVRSKFGLKARKFEPNTEEIIDRVEPWGWSEAIAQRMRGMGFKESLLTPKPGVIDIDRFERHRQLSHRRNSILFNRRLSEIGVHTPPEALEISNLEDLASLIAKGGRYVMKAPWSSSGRGIMDTGSMSAEEIMRRVGGIIRNQGSVIAETYLEGVVNFAMLFQVKAGQATYAGLSLFGNSGLLDYTSNIVASESVLRQRLLENVTLEFIPSHEIMEEVVTEIYGNKYEGWLGVDMMAYRNADSTISVAPCIEVNLRTTMGVVAHLLARRILAEGITAKMIMETGGEPVVEDYVAENRKLFSGTLYLTPPQHRFRLKLVANSL